jgi:hypothetical protein
LDCQEGDCYSVRNPPTWAIDVVKYRFLFPRLSTLTLTAVLSQLHICTGLPIIDAPQLPSAAASKPHLMLVEVRDNRRICFMPRSSFVLLFILQLDSCDARGL